MNCLAVDVNEETLKDLISVLSQKGFEPYLTSVGGSGLGILSPYAHHRVQPPAVRHVPGLLGQVTPPDTPLVQEEEGDEKAVNELHPLRPSFVASVKEDLTEWSSSLGRWLYV